MWRRLFVVLSACVSFAAWAECKQYSVSWRLPDVSWQSTAALACSVLNGKSVTTGTGKSAVTISVSNAKLDKYGNCAYNEVSKYADGTPTYTFPTSSAVESRTVDTCGDFCTAKAGTSSIVNITSGWKRTPKPDDYAEDWVITYRFPPSGTATICGGPDVCEMTADVNEPCSDCGAYVSQVPAANGMYRVSTDFRGHYTGKTCTPSSTSDLPPEALQKDDAKDPPCPGYVGEVNGVKGCYGTASKPINPVPANPRPPGISGTDAGNPAAGPKPGSGEGSGSGGSGRTPSAGTGGSSGGPAGAASGSNGGTKPDGTTTAPGEGKEQAACGAPGQPKCSIDESGTPSKYDGNGAALDGWKEGVDKNRGTIEKSGTGIFESFNVFFSAPPLVGCEAIELPNDQVITRHCDVVDGTRSVMAYIWALTALWLCVGWIREAI